MNPNVTHLCLASLLWDKGKQNSPRCDTAERGVQSGAILFAKRIFIKNSYENIKSVLMTQKNESGLTQMIMMGKSICQIWVKLVLEQVQAHNNFIWLVGWFGVQHPTKSWSYGDGTLLYSPQTGDALDRICDPWFKRRMT